MSEVVCIFHFSKEMREWNCFLLPSPLLVWVTFSFLPERNDDNIGMEREEGKWMRKWWSSSLISTKKGFSCSSTSITQAVRCCSCFVLSFLLFLSQCWWWSSSSSLKGGDGYHWERQSSRHCSSRVHSGVCSLPSVFDSWLWWYDYSETFISRLHFSSKNPSPFLMVMMMIFLSCVWLWFWKSNSARASFSMIFHDFACEVKGKDGDFSVSTRTHSREKESASSPIHLVYCLIHTQTPQQV